jgi:serine/threonine protein kinase
LIKCIGYGGYGRVYDAIRSDDNQPVIIKLIPKSGIVNWSTKSPSSIPNYKIGSMAANKNIGSSSSSSSSSTSSVIPFEIECLLRLRDTPGIIRILDFFEETTCFVIVMEKLNRCTTLFDLANGKPFSFSQLILRKIFTQLIRINLTLFAKGIVHRDIKPENILVNLEDYSIKLIDFGSAATFKPRGELFHEFQGTLECMPPEWILSGFYESEPATVWSIGVTFYFSIFGKYPFRTKHAIALGKYPLYYSNVMSDYLNFLDTCFNMSNSKRVSLHHLLNTPLLKRYHDTSNKH